jgi:holo-[acyl-carrier protein] synthase
MNWRDDILIKGLGVDLCLDARIRERTQSEHFVQRVFIPEEIMYARNSKHPERHFASSFAAREAFVKASGADFFSVVFQGVWLQRQKKGISLRLSDKIIKMDNSLSRYSFYISISHERGMTVAVVIMEE